MQLPDLIPTIQTTHNHTHRFALQQANVALTIQNWGLGFTWWNRSSRERIGLREPGFLKNWVDGWLR